jgi:hypothetical protein
MEDIEDIIKKPITELSMVILANNMHGIVMNDAEYIKNPFTYLFRLIESACNVVNLLENYDSNDVPDKFFLEETIDDIDELTQQQRFTVENFNVELNQKFIPKKTKYVTELTKHMYPKYKPDTRYSKYFQRENTYLYNKWFDMDKFKDLKYIHNTTDGIKPCSFSGL